MIYLFSLPSINNLGLFDKIVLKKKWALDIANENWVFDIANEDWAFDIANENWAFDIATGLNDGL